MRKLALILAAGACVGLATPSFAAGIMATGQSAPQLTQAADGAKSFDLVAAKKKSKKKTSRKSWGG